MRWKTYWKLFLHHVHLVRLKPTPLVRYQVFMRDGFKCKACGRRHNLTLDHIYPRSRGGESTIENLQVLCHPCNLSKGADIHPQFQHMEYVRPRIQALLDFVRNTPVENEADLVEEARARIFNILYLSAKHGELPIQEKVSRLRRELAVPGQVPNYYRERNRQLMMLAQERKQLEEEAHRMRNYNEYGLLKEFVAARYGRKVLSEFYDLLKTKRADKKSPYYQKTDTPV